MYLFVLYYRQTFLFLGYLEVDFTASCDLGHGTNDKQQLEMFMISENCELNCKFIGNVGR